MLGHLTHLMHCTMMRRYMHSRVAHDPGMTSITRSVASVIAACHVSESFDRLAQRPWSDDIAVSAVHAACQLSSGSQPGALPPAAKATESGEASGFSSAGRFAACDDSCKNAVQAILSILPCKEERCCRGQFLLRGQYRPGLKIHIRQRQSDCQTV